MKIIIRLTQSKYDDLFELVLNDFLNVVPDNRWRDSAHNIQTLTQILVKIVTWTTYLITDNGFWYLYA
jgi:hypothetical protein